MPTYEYACEACGHGFEHEQRMSDDPLRKCPQCGKRKLRRIVSGGYVHVKSGGGSSPPLACGRDAPCAGGDSPCMQRAAGL